jgi:hypothetical protein
MTTKLDDPTTGADGPTSRPVPQWIRPGATRVGTLGRDGQQY